MEIIQIKAFLVVAETLHFGRAAQQLEILPASLTRHIRLLEERYDTRLFDRTTRTVSLTDAGQAFLPEAQALMAQVARCEARLADLRQTDTAVLRIGAIDSAATGLMPQLLQALRAAHPEISVRILEQKSNHLLPKVLNGSLDIAFCRPPEVRDPKLRFRTLFYETPVVAIPKDHPLARQAEVDIRALEDAPMIVPERRTRPFSHDLTIKLFADAGLQVRIAMTAAEKQTIVNLVSTGAGLAIVPRWVSRLAVEGVAFARLVPVTHLPRPQLVLAAAWAGGTRDPRRDALLSVLDRNIEAFADTA